MGNHSIFTNSGVRGHVDQHRPADWRRIQGLLGHLLVKMEQFYFFVLTMKEAANYHCDVGDRKAIEYIDTSDMAILKGKAALISYSKTGQQLMKQSLLGYLTEMRGHYDQGNVAYWMALHTGMDSQARIEKAIASQEQGLGSSSPGTVQEHGDAASATNFEESHSLAEEQIVPLDSASPHGLSVMTNGQGQETLPLGSPTTGTFQDESGDSAAADSEADPSVMTNGQGQETLPLGSPTTGTFQDESGDSAAADSEADPSVMTNGQVQETLSLGIPTTGTFQDDSGDSAAADSEADPSVMTNGQVQETLSLGIPTTGTFQDDSGDSAAADSEADPSVMTNGQVQETLPLGIPTTGTFQDESAGDSAAADSEADPSVTTNNQGQERIALDTTSSNKAQDNSDSVTSTDFSTLPSSRDSPHLVDSTSTEPSPTCLPQNNRRARSYQKTTLLGRLRQGFQRLFGIKQKKIFPVTEAEDQHVPLNLTDIDSKVFAQEITMLNKEMFGKIGLDEILDERWKSQERWTCSPNVTDMSEFYLRVVSMVTIEILAQKRPKQRACVIAKVIKMAGRCAEIHNYHATKAILTSIRSRPILRLRRTWEKVKNKSKRLLRHLFVLTSSADEYAIVYRHKLACKKNANSLHFLGDVLGQMNHIQSVYSENEDDNNIHLCVDVSGELQDLLCSYQDAAEGYNYPRHPGVAKFLLKMAAVEDMVDNYDLSLEREPETEL